MISWPIMACQERGEVSLGWPLGRPWKRERVSGIRWGSEWEMRWKLWRIAIIGKLGNGNALACGGEGKK